MSDRKLKPELTSEGLVMHPGGLPIGLDEIHVVRLYSMTAEPDSPRQLIYLTFEHDCGTYLEIPAGTDGWEELVAALPRAFDLGDVDLAETISELSASEGERVLFER